MFSLKAIALFFLARSRILSLAVSIISQPLPSSSLPYVLILIISPSLIVLLRARCFTRPLLF
ncbi:membrane protein [Candidatus Magnetoovum chiemensis]|nr:membrane protein [Candidatus Magnetoovum chiemensis]